MQRTKIAVLIDWFVPGYKAGGPIQSCVNFCLAMKDDFEIFVITTDTDLNDKEAYQGIVSNQWTTYLPNVNTYYLSKQNTTYHNILELINSILPDYVYLNQLFSTRFVIMPLIMKWRKQIQAAVVLCPRGALYDSAMRHQNSYIKKISFIKILSWAGGFKGIKFHATNGEERVAIRKYFLKNIIIEANNFGNNSQSDFAETKKEQGRLNIVFIARILPIKNLLFACQIIKEIKSIVRFTIVGPIEDASYWQKCKEVIANFHSSVSVEIAGPKGNNEIDSILKQNHFYFLPTTGENFGHSIFESFLAGRPVLISDQTPWRELATKRIGWDLPLSEPALFVKAIEEACEWDQKQFDEYAHFAWRFAKNFNEIPKQKIQYRELFD
jgi:glycosyltransferase involved in cell wall biosynthesis